MFMLELQHLYGVDEIYWFENDENGISLVRPNGSRLSERSFPLDEHPDFCKSKDAVDGWKRAMLFTEEFNIWDCTAFSASMNAVICCPDKKHGAFIFLTPQSLDRISIRILSQTKRKAISENLLEFYSSPNLQAKVSALLLHGVVLYFNGTSLEPVSMKEAVDHLSQQWHVDCYPLLCKLNAKNIKAELVRYWKDQEEFT